MSVEPPPDLLISGVTPSTDIFVVVIGAYNFSICKNCAQPVVGLPRGWVPEYKFFFPFSTARLCEFVITRVPPAATGTVDINPAASRAAISSANFEVNFSVVQSLARDPWARKHFKIANGGVLSVAQHRFRATDVFAKEEYLKQFVALPTDARAIATLCRPPEISVLPAPIAPPSQVSNSPYDWDISSEESKAAALAAWSKFWFQPTPTAGIGRTSGAAVVVPPPVAEGLDASGYKEAPSPEQIQSMQDAQATYKGP
jgi:hypothetical protein